MDAKQIIAEAVSDEYEARGITNNVNSLYKSDVALLNEGQIEKEKKEMPTIGSWYKRILKMAKIKQTPLKKSIMFC